MTRSVVWRRVDDSSMEWCRIVEGEGDHGASVVGTVVGVLGQVPFRCSYALAVDGRWRTTRVEVDAVVGPDDPETHAIVRDPDGRWTMDGEAVPSVTGALDIDLAFSPATNSLPIRRLSLAEGESADVLAAWFRFPEMRLEPLLQRYTRVDASTYRYRSDSGFRATLVTDDHGLVTTYEDGWERVGEA